MPVIMKIVVVVGTVSQSKLWWVCCIFRVQILFIYGSLPKPLSCALEMVTDSQKIFVAVAIDMCGIITKKSTNMYL